MQQGVDAVEVRLYRSFQVLLLVVKVLLQLFAFVEPFPPLQLALANLIDHLLKGVSLPNRNISQEAILMVSVIYTRTALPTDFFTARFAEVV